MARRVVVTGVGMLNALGDSPAVFHTALCEGASGLSAVTTEDVDVGCHLAGHLELKARDYLGKKSLRPLDRISRLVTIAAKLALADSGWTAERLEQHEVGIVLGTMYGSVHSIAKFDRRAQTAGPMYASPLDFANTVINAAAGQTAIWHTLRGLNSTISTGARSGLDALAYAADTIRRGEYPALLAGGAEEFSPEVFQGFARAGRLCGSSPSSAGDGEYPIPFDARRNGFALGEGAALLMLEDGDVAAARGATVLAEIKGMGNTFNPVRDGAPHAEETARTAIARAVGCALDASDLPTGAIDCVAAAANGSPRDDRLEADGLASALGARASDVPIAAIKSMTGELLGASGAFQVVAMIESMRTGTVPGVAGLEHPDANLPLGGLSRTSRAVDVRHALINAVGFDHSCCSLVLGSAASS